MTIKLRSLEGRLPLYDAEVGPKRRARVTFSIDRQPAASLCGRGLDWTWL
ncbi:MAG TPA: hypothetical protein VF544_06895 [Pyrinomonadaceae bacterium]